MAQTYQARRIAEGRKVDYTPGSDVSAGNVVVQGSLVGMAEVDIPANALGALTADGIFDVVKIQGEMSAGDPLYWDADGDPYNGTVGTGAATTVSANGDFMGFATADAAETDEVVRLTLIQPVSVTVYNELTNVIADPGDTGAIPVTLGGHCSLVTAGVETRTLADPSHAGQLLALSLKTDGGTCVVTAASPIDQNGRTTITFDDPGDAIVLIGVEDGADKEWRVLTDDTAITRYNDLTNPIADPGDTGAIPVTVGGHCALVTAAAETRTLAAPSFIGQQLLLYMKTDNGDAVVTCSTTINETGNNTITFANTGEAVLLTAVEEGATLRWRLATADGAALSTV